MASALTIPNPVRFTKSVAIIVQLSTEESLGKYIGIGVGVSALQNIDSTVTRLLKFALIKHLILKREKLRTLRSVLL